MRSIWSGHITFGLISIPVGIYTALESAARVSFHLLHRKDMAPIRYKKVCSREDVEVPNDEIVQGYEVAKGRYKVVEKEEIEQVENEGGEPDRTIDVVQFVDLSSISPLLFEKPYYMAPQEGGEKAYALLRQALAETRRVGIARFRMRNKPELAAIVPGAEVMSLGMLRTFDEIRDPSSLKLKLPAPRANELDLARMLIEQMTAAWDPTQHPNEYRKAMDKLLASKTTVEAAAAPGEKREKVVDIMEALRRSVAQAQGRGGNAAERTPPKRATKKRRPRRAA